MAANDGRKRTVWKVFFLIMLLRSHAYAAIQRSQPLITGSERRTSDSQQQSKSKHGLHGVSLGPLTAGESSKSAYCNATTS
jgi:hypothetical protein